MPELSTGSVSKDFHISARAGKYILHTVKITHKTERAIQIERFRNPQKKVWLPLSQIRVVLMDGRGFVDVEVPGWLAMRVQEEL